MERNEKTGYKNNGNEFENTEIKSSKHADEHSQSDVDISKSKSMKRNGETGYENNENVFENAETETSKHADGYK
jgi:hypothetical protein